MNENKIGVHTSHCCEVHGCKYGESDCPVENGKYEQEYPCESCDEDNDIPIIEIKQKIPQFTSAKLCKMIVTSRYLGFAKELEKDCMLELAKRRSDGENFPFEKTIEDDLKSLPAIHFGIPDIRDVLNKAIGSKLR